MSDSKHTIHSIGERVEEIYTKIESETAPIFLWLTKKHISALAGFALIVGAMYVGARLF